MSGKRGVTRWTWVKFLTSKDNAYDVFSNFCTQIQSEKEMKILKVRSDHCGEFENEPLKLFVKKHEIIHEFSSPRTPQQNEVVERTNRTLQEMASTMIHENNLAKHFWAEAVNNKLYLKKFDAKAQRGIFLGCSERSKAYKVYDSETLCVEESMHVKFDDKESGNETPKQGESFADMQVPEDISEPDQTSESEENPEAEPTPEAQDEVASAEAQDGS